MVELGSSDAAVVMGCSPYRTPFQLWARLVGLIPDDEPETEVMRSGTFLQDSVLREFCLREHWVIEKDQPVYYHKSKPHLRATPDGLMLRYERGEDRTVLALAEVKTFVNYAPDVPRVDHLVQVQHQRMVTESVEAEIQEHYLIYFGGLRLTWFLIPRHQGAIDRIQREEEKFLELVERQVPPPVSARDASVLNKAWPWAEAKAVRLSDSLVWQDRAIEHADEEIARWTRERDASEAIIKAAMGDATEGVLGNGTRYTWKPGPRKGYTVQPSRVRPFKRHGRKDDAEG